MGNKVVVSPQADIDVDAAWSFIAPHNLTAAYDLIDRITAASQMLAATPMMGRARPELRKNIRSFPIDSYLIFYTPIPGGIEIVRVIHGRRKVSRKDMT